MLFLLEEKKKFANLKFKNFTLLNIGIPVIDINLDFIYSYYIPLFFF